MSRRRSRSRAAASEEEDDDEDELIIEEEEDDEEVFEERAPRSRKKKKAPAKKKPTRKKRNSFVVEDDEEEDEFDDFDDEAPRKKKGSKKGGTRRSPFDGAEVSPASQQVSAVTRKFNALSAGEQQRLVSGLVRLMLLKHREQARASVADVTKYVLQDDFKGMKITGELVKRAQGVLREVFGLELVVQDKMYFLRSTLKLQNPYEFLEWEDPAPLAGLAAMIVGMMHTSQAQRIEEEQLFQMLLPLGFHPDSPHPCFGKWEDAISKKLTTEQKYLIREKEKDDHGDVTWFYRVGPRLKVETTLRSAEAFVSEIYGRAVDENKLKELATDRGLEEEEEPAAGSQRPKRKAASATKKRKSRRRKQDSSDESDSE